MTNHRAAQPPLAVLLTEAGHQVTVSNSRSPETLAGLVG
jgi:hypothetical protein